MRKHQHDFSSMCLLLAILPLPITALLMAIPGALRADPGKVRHRTRIVMPEGTGVSYMNYRRGPIGVVRVVSFYSCDLAAIEMQCDLNYRQSLRSREPSCAGPRCHCIPTVLFR